MNDHILDSAAFLTDFRTATPRPAGGGGPDTEFEGEAVPEPSSAILLGVGAAGLLGYFSVRRVRRG